MSRTDEHHVISQQAKEQLKSDQKKGHERSVQKKLKESLKRRAGKLWNNRTGGEARVGEVIVIKRIKDGKIITEDTENLIQSYLNVLRKEYSQFLKEEVSVQFKVAPYYSGIIIELRYKPFGRNTDTFISKITDIGFSEAFNQYFGIDILNFFKEDEKIKVYEADKSNSLIISGTGLILANDRIFLIKELTQQEWTPEAAKKDVERILLA